MATVQTEIIKKLETYVYTFTQANFPEFVFVDKRKPIERNKVNTVMISMDFLNHIQQRITVGGMAAPFKPMITKKRAQLKINLYYPKGYDMVKIHDYTQLVQDSFQKYEATVSGYAKLVNDQVSISEYNPIDDVFLMEYTITFALYERV